MSRLNVFLGLNNNLRVEAPLLELSERNIRFTNLDLSLSSTYGRFFQLKKQFWARWSREYLLQLTSRPLEHQAKKVMQVGDLAVIQENSLPPLHRKLGRVVNLFPEKDPVIPVVDLEVTFGIIRSPVSRLVILQVSPPEPSRC